MTEKKLSDSEMEEVVGGKQTQPTTDVPRFPPEPPETPWYDVEPLPDPPHGIIKKPRPGKK